MTTNKNDYFCLVASKAILRSGLIYYLVKILDLFETVIFVLKKKNNQVSFLHVYHHVSIFIITYVGLTSNSKNIFDNLKWCFEVFSLKYFQVLVTASFTVSLTALYTWSCTCTTSSVPTIHTASFWKWKSS